MDSVIKKRYHVIISGRVQGVAFRAYTKQKADSLGLAGWVKNITQGRVEAVYEGDEESVSAMTDWCHRGPSLARVDKLDMQEEPIAGLFTDFRILY
jgi:acylphosphatase